MPLLLSFRSVLRLAVVTLALALSGCTSQIAFLNDHTSLIGGRLAEKGTNVFFLWGFGQEYVVDAIAICDGEKNVLAVRTYANFGDAFVSLLTVGVIAPLSYEVYCDDGSRRRGPSQLPRVPRGGR